VKHLLSRIYRLQLKLGFGPNKNGWEMGFRKSGLGNDMGSRPPSGPSYKACPGIRSRSNSITVNFTKLWPQMFRTSLRNSQVRCGVQKFIMRFTNQFVNYAFDWLLLLQGPVRDRLCLQIGLWIPIWTSELRNELRNEVRNICVQSFVKSTVKACSDQLGAS
jgi:hypothetical protein